MNIYVKTSNHPTAHTICIRDDDFLQLQDEFWPMTGNKIDPDAFWKFKLKLRETGDSISVKTPTEYTFIVSTNRDVNEDAIKEINQTADDEEFFEDVGVRCLNSDVVSYHYFIRKPNDDVFHTMRIQMHVHDMDNQDFVNELEQLIRKYKTEQAPATISDDVVDAALSAATVNNSGE
jgi:hypothetical protein